MADPNPELPPGETPLAERLADAADDIADATDIFYFAKTRLEEHDRDAALLEVCEAGNYLGRALLKVVTILRQEGL